MNKGFTVLEFMIVATIISIILTIFGPNMFIMMEKARHSDVMNNAKRLQQTLEEYNLEAEEKGWFQNYPRNCASLMASDAWKKYKLKNPYFNAYNFLDKITNIITFTPEAYADNIGIYYETEVSDAVVLQSPPNSSGSVVIFIPHSVLLYKSIVASGYLSSSPSVRGAIIYFPFKSISTGSQDWPSSSGDLIGGYEIRGVDSEGRLLKNIVITGGEKLE